MAKCPYVLCFALFLASPWCCLSGTGMWNKHNALFSGYDAMMPPTDMGDPDPLKVYFGISVKAMKFDIMAAHLEIQYWFRLAWLEPRLLYDGFNMFGANHANASEYLPVKLMHGDNSKLWIPDVFCLNSTDAHVQHYGTAPMEAYLFSQQHVSATTPWNIMLSRPSSMNVYCKPTLEMFPFDEQKCDLHFTSWGHNAKYIMMELLGGSGFQQTINFPDSNEYSWMPGQADDYKIVNTYYGAAGSGYSEVVMTVRLTRCPMYYMLNAILPMFMMVVLSNFALWMPINPEWAGAGERMSFSITCLLTIVAVGLFTADKRPMLKETTWLDTWMSYCLLFTAVPIMESIVVYFLDSNFQSVIQQDRKHQEAQAEEAARSRNPESAFTTQKTSKFTKYANVAYEADHIQAQRSKRVMRIVYWMKQNIPLGFFTPRGIDLWVRNIFPVIAVGKLWAMLWEVAAHKLRLDAAPVLTLMVPFGLVSILLFIAGAAWLIYENISHFKAYKALHPRPDENAEDSSSSEEDSEELDSSPTYMGGGHYTRRRR